MQTKAKIFQAILKTALIAGLFDITAAVINYMISNGGKNPVVIFKYIASAVFGRDRAYSEGWLMVFLGLLFHFMIAFIFTAFFFFIYPKIKWLQKNIFITGLAYGVFVWLVMNLVVVPSSNAPHFPFKINAQAMIGVLILMFVFGLPVAWLAKRHFSNIQVEGK